MRMEAIDYTAVRKVFCFVVDDNEFYNKQTKRKVKETSVRKKIIEFYPELSKNGAMVDDVVQMVRDFGHSKEDLLQTSEKQFGKSEKRTAIYNEAKDYLPLRWFASVAGDSRLFYINDNNEVTFAGEASQLNFENVIRGAKSEVLTALTALHKVSPYVVNDSGRITVEFEDYLKVIFNKFKYDIDKRLEKDPPILTHDSDEIAYKRFNPAILKDGPTPYWDQFLTRLNFSDVFMAWVWSIFDPRNKGRQILWLHGKGNDGKSTAISAITEWLGEDNVMPIDENTSSQFFYSKVYGKRLAVFGDCKSPRYIAGSKIHSLVGGDYVPIERKGEQPFTAHVQIKLLIASNLFPEIDFSMPNEASRLLLLKLKQPKMDDGDPNFKEGLVSEKSAFLFKCKQSYDKLCPNHAKIHVPEELDTEMLEDASSKEYNFVTAYVEDHLDFTDKDAKIKSVDLLEDFERVARARYVDNSKFNRIRRDLLARLEQEGIYKTRIHFGTKNGKRDSTNGFYGVKVIGGLD